VTEAFVRLKAIVSIGIPTITPFRLLECTEKIKASCSQ
jgi:hypothetical protein